ncbi:hypothetical protein D8674_017000 [Pyrus ussuriensis x Pyrus communis]|uniref:Uncharacterized protein n=1 Tax=Pyrus ussuriensis x Pyrus communis TaxID=2448454 RepID=A0A5N5HIL7_9ROSA|nr:hypothetical protein D8674_017000 [Pyrus ussuriensis x Pyrus communis]
MGPTSSPPSSIATLLSNPSSSALTLLALAIPTTIAPILIFSSSSHSTSKLRFNGTYGTRVSEIVRSSLTFKAKKFTISDDRARGRDGNGENNEGEEKGSDEEMDDRAVDLQFLINGLELDRRDVATFFFFLKV